jgi:hypothetical protein
MAGVAVFHFNPYVFFTGKEKFTCSHWEQKARE